MRERLRALRERLDPLCALTARLPGGPFPWLLGLLAVVYALYFWTNPLDAELFAADSRGYIEFAPERSAGYPLFLDLIDVFGAANTTPPVQVALAAGAFAFLGWSVWRAFGTPFAALILVALMLTDRTLGGLHAVILADSLFASLLAVTAGAIALTAARGSWRWAAVGSAASGLAIAVRPEALGLLPAWPLLLWLVWRRAEGARLRLAAAVAAPLLLALIAEDAVWNARHGGSADRSNPPNVQLFAKSLLMGSEPDAPAGLADFAALGRETMAPARELVADAPGLQGRALTLRRFEVAARGDTYRRALQGEGRALAREREDSIDTVFADLGSAAAPWRPAAWGNALVHYGGLWRAYWSYGSGFIEDYEAWTATLERTPLFEEANVFRPLSPAPPWPRWKLATRFVPAPLKSAWLSVADWLPTTDGARLKLALGLAASIAALGIAIEQRERRSRIPDGRVATAAVCGLMVHGHFLWVGLTGPAAPNYAFAVWPLLAISFLLTASWALDGARALLARRFPRLAPSG